MNEAEWLEYLTSPSGIFVQVVIGLILGLLIGTLIWRIYERFSRGDKHEW
nr:MAG: hypothetical protein [uncultured archaeon]